MKTGIEIIADERKRQVEEEGYTAEHDAMHVNGELADAAATYAMNKNTRSALTSLTYHSMMDGICPTWPFDYEWWKESPEDRIKELAKAGALIAAEIDRLLKIKELEDNLEEE